MTMPEFMVRVKLPASGEFHCSPSGDTEYEDARHKCLSAAIPEGFSEKPMRSGHNCPKDNEGYTWVLLKYDEQREDNSIQAWMQRARKAENELVQLKKKLAQLSC